MKITDKILVMRKGQCTGDLFTKDATPEILSNMMVGRAVDLNIPRQTFQPKETVLEVKDLCALDSRGLPALDGVSFSVRKGEIVGIAGVEGNGQTELIQVIAGMHKAESGSVIFNNVDITHESVRKRRQSGMAHVPEDRLAMGIASNCTIQENLIVNRYFESPFSEHFVLKAEKIYDFSEELCEDFEVKVPDSYYQVGTLSGGNMQKVVLARELENNPTLLIAAQPSRGVDIGAIESIHKRLIQVRDTDRAVLLISAELDEVLSLSDRVLVMYEGKITAEFSREEANEQVIARYMTGSAHTEERGA